MIKRIILFIIILSFLPIPLYGQSGVYNSWSGLFWCEPESCLHEIGHKLDDLSGWISKSAEFEEAIIKIGLDFQLETIGPQETYASVYSFAEGKKENMPAELQSFYDWEISERLLNN